VEILDHLLEKGCRLDSSLYFHVDRDNLPMAQWLYDHGCAVPDSGILMTDWISTKRDLGTVPQVIEDTLAVYFGNKTW
jgi:hypothetical protein